MLLNDFSTDGHDGHRILSLDFWKQERRKAAGWYLRIRYYIFNCICTNQCGWLGCLSFAHCAAASNDLRKFVLTFVWKYRIKKSSSGGKWVNKWIKFKWDKFVWFMAFANKWWTRCVWVWKIETITFIPALNENEAFCMAHSHRENACANWWLLLLLSAVTASVCDEMSTVTQRTHRYNKYYKLKNNIS